MPTSLRWMVIALLLASCSGMAGDAGYEDDSTSGGEGGKWQPDSGSGGGSVSVGGRGGASSFGGAGGSSSMGGNGVPVMLDPCSDDNLKITPLWDANAFRIIAGPDRVATVRVERTRPIQQPEPDKWTWEVEHGGNVVTTKFSGGAECSFPVLESGQYTVVATNQYDCRVSTSLRAIAEGERATHLWMRVLPPESRRLTPHERFVSLTVGAAPDPENVSLKQGLAVTIAPSRRSATGALDVPSFVRIVRRDSTFRWEGHTRTGTPGDGRFMAQLDPFPRYDVLIVPEDNFAPVFLKSQLAEEIAARALQLDAGTEVSGSVTTAEGPLAGARVLLRAGDVPSTVATTDQAGRFSVLAQAGRYSIIVRPADRSPFPDLVVPEGSGLSVPATGRLTNVKVQFATLPVSDVTVQVSAPNRTPLANVALELTNTAALPGAGAIELSAGAPMAANGSVVRRATTDASGKAFFAAVPRGAYTLRMVPPRAPGLARTETALVIDAAEQLVAASVLAPVAVTGALGTSDATSSLAGAVVTAYDAASPMDGAKTAKVDADGRFALLLDPKREYRVRMIPPPASALPATPLTKLLVGTDPVTLPLRTLPRAKAVHGTVTDDRGTAVAGAIVQIYCVGDGADCFTRAADDSAYSVVTAVPLAEVLTDAAGKFTLNGIDPASL